MERKYQRLGTVTLWEGTQRPSVQLGCVGLLSLGDLAGFVVGNVSIKSMVKWHGRLSTITMRLLFLWWLLTLVSSAATKEPPTLLVVVVIVAVVISLVLHLLWEPVKDGIVLHVNDAGV